MSGNPADCSRCGSSRAMCVCGSEEKDDEDEED